MKKCDLGILLGGPILEKQFNELISIINQNLKNRKDEESVNSASGPSPGFAVFAPETMRLHPEDRISAPLP